MEEKTATSISNELRKISCLKQFADRTPSEFLEKYMNIKLLDYQKKLVNRMTAMNNYRSIYGENHEFKCAVEEMERIKKEMSERMFMDTYSNLMNGQVLYASSIYESASKITGIEVIVPNKVVEVTFGDGQKEKMICNEEDKYNLRQCLFIAIAKHLYKKDYTQEGIEYKANELKYLKKYVKIVDDALKEYHKKCENIKKLEENYEKELESIARKRAKREAYKARREQKRKEEQIAIQKEAYIQAMEYMENSKNVAAN